MRLPLQKAPKPAARSVLLLVFVLLRPLLNPTPLPKNRECLSSATARVGGCNTVEAPDLYCTDGGVAAAYAPATVAIAVTPNANLCVVIFLPPADPTAASVAVPVRVAAQGGGISNVNAAVWTLVTRSGTGGVSQRRL